jgi:hypothetical protein
MGLENILTTVLQNFLNLLPVRIVHSYEQGVRFSFGEDTALIRNSGIYFYIPLVQSIEIQSVAEDGIILPNQAVETKDKVSVSVSGVVSYKIRNLRLYWTRVKDFNKVLSMNAMAYLSREVRKYSYEEVHQCIPPKDSPRRYNYNKKKKDEKPSNGNSESKEYQDTDPEEQDVILPRGNSELEQNVIESLQEKVWDWGVNLVDFYINNLTRTRSFRIFGDINAPTDNENAFQKV